MVRHTLPDWGAASQGIRTGQGPLPWSESAGATGHHGHLPAPAFSLLAITQPSLFCVAVGTRLLLVYIGDCTHSSNGFGSLSLPVSPPHTWVEVKPNICCHVKTTSGWPILRKLHQLFENSRLVPVLKKNMDIFFILRRTNSPITTPHIYSYFSSHILRSEYHGLPSRVDLPIDPG